MHLQRQLGANGDAARPGAALMRELEQTRLDISKIDNEMLNVPLLTPQQLLEQVHEVFSRPDQFVMLSKYELRLNRMGIKIEQDSTQAFNRLDLTEVVLGNEAPRVITLATFPAGELFN